MGLQIDFDVQASPASTEVLKKSFAVTFDGDETVYTSSVGSASTVQIEGGPRGLKGDDGDDAFEVWKQIKGLPNATEADYLDDIVGADGAPGPSGYIVYNSGTSTYPARPLPGQPVTFVGPVSPLDIGVTMVNNDVWVNTTPDAVNNTVYVAVTQLDTLVTTLVQQTSPTASALRTAILALIDARIAAQSSKPKDVRLNVQSNQTSVDEFEAATVDGSWLKADGSNPERVTWRQGGGGLSFNHTGGDAASLLHALLRPVTALAVGEAWETHLRMNVAWNASSSMMGLMVATSGTASQYMVAANIWTDSSVSGAINIGVRQHTNLNTSGGGDGGSVNNWGGSRLIGNAVYMRLARTGANQWDIQVSGDGISWMTTNRLTPARLNDTYTHVGFYCSTWASAVPFTGSFDYLRRVTL